LTTVTAAGWVGAAVGAGVAGGCVGAAVGAGVGAGVAGGCVGAGVGAAVGAGVAGGCVGAAVGAGVGAGVAGGCVVGALVVVRFGFFTVVGAAATVVATAVVVTRAVVVEAATVVVEAEVMAGCTSAVRSDPQAPARTAAARATVSVRKVFMFSMMCSRSAAAAAGHPVTNISSPVSVIVVNPGGCRRCVNRVRRHGLTGQNTVF
jgi:hypothetical protein